MQRIATACILSVTVLGLDIDERTAPADDSGVFGYAEISERCEAAVEEAD